MHNDNNKPTYEFLKWWSPCIGVLHGKQLYMSKNNYTQVATWNTSGYMELVA